MKQRTPGRSPKAGPPPPPDDRKPAPAAKANPKLAEQTRKRLGKHYASKYQTVRRG